MLTRKIILLLPFLVSFSLMVPGQIKDVGLPYIKNFTRDIYNAGSQNWDIVQDQKGLIYVANNNGVLEFDGSKWELYMVPNESEVRAIAIGNDNLIYAGAFNEIGYLKKMPNGKLVYHSLVDLIPSANRNFDEIWKIFQTDFGIVFQSFNYAFVFSNHKIQVIKPFSTFSFSFYVNGKYYIVDREKGIMLYQHGELKPFFNDSQLSNVEIRFILPYPNHQLMIGTLTKGAFLFDGKTLTPWITPLNQTLIRKQLFSGISMDQDNFVFGSVQDGVFITNKDGNILQHINRENGLQNNTVLNLFRDKLKNLWLGLDNGISYMEVSSPITCFNYCYGVETGYASVVFDKMLYLGTNQGLYAKRLDQLKNNLTSDSKFRLVEGTEGQVWCLKVIDNKLFCGHNNGGFLIHGFTSQRVTDVRGLWNFVPLSGKKDKLICGTYNGFIILAKEPGLQNNWRFLKKIKGFNESCKVIEEDIDKSIWVSHEYRGIYRLKLSPSLDSVISTRLFNKNDGLPAKLPYHLTRIDDNLVITTDHGVFVYDSLHRTFSPSQKYNDFFQSNNQISQLITDSQNNRWYFANKRMGVYRLLEDGSYIEISIPFLKFSNSLVTSYEHLFPYDHNNVFIATQSGFVHYNPSFTKDYNTIYNAYIRRIRLLKLTSDSILAYQGNKGISEQAFMEHFSIPYQYNSLSFEFSAPFYEDPDKTEYRYRLLGFEESWSPWDGRNIKEYTNLPEGRYRFEVQAINLYKSISISDSYSFYIQPPFYKTKVAYIFYILLFIIIIVGNILYFKRRIERTRLKEKLKHDKKMMALQHEYKEESAEANEKIEQLRNERLISEIKHKNKELANSTMHLIQKNKFLNVIKNEINKVVEENSPISQKNALQRLLRHIDKDLNNEKHSKVFDEYFDDVHQDFLARMKEKHRALTPKELRLCAYLRMNLSSKEIATLMNISIRGVEVSRYRLRKKLDLERDTNLTEYILNF